MNRWDLRTWGLSEPFLSNKFKQHFQVDWGTLSWTEPSLEISSNMQICESVENTVYSSHQERPFPKGEPSWFRLISFFATFANLFAIWLQKHLWTLSTVKFFFPPFLNQNNVPCSETITSLSNIYKLDARTSPFWECWEDQMKQFLQKNSVKL